LANFTTDEIKLIKEQYPVLGISIAPQLGGYDNMNNEGHDDNTRVAKKCSICGRTPEHWRGTPKRALDARVIFRGQDKEMIEAAKGLVACYWGMKSGIQKNNLNDIN
jgi:hypothetical protein